MEVAASAKSKMIVHCNIFIAVLRMNNNNLQFNHLIKFLLNKSGETQSYSTHSALPIAYARSQAKGLRRAALTKRSLPFFKGLLITTWPSRVPRLSEGAKPRSLLSLISSPAPLPLPAPKPPPSKTSRQRRPKGQISQSESVICSQRLGGRISARLAHMLMAINTINPAISGCSLRTTFPALLNKSWPSSNRSGSA